MKQKHTSLRMNAWSTVSILLCIVLCLYLSSAPVAAEGASPSFLHPPIVEQDEHTPTGLKTTWSCVFFGAYPCAEVVDSDWDAVDDYALRPGDVIRDDALYARLESADCPIKSKMQLDLAVEEIFVNIANYAYAPEIGKATVRVEVSGDPITVSITFIDRGVPYDPLKKADPDVTLSAAERDIGGLGIFLTKKMMDDISYEYKNGQNILTLKKTL